MKAGDSARVGIAGARYRIFRLAVPEQTESKPAEKKARLLLPRLARHALSLVDLSIIVLNLV
jgi:hypothetical protein